MQLDKFYVDVVGPDGSGCIGYAARLDGFGMAATLAATMRWDAAQPPAVAQQRTLRGRLPVAVADGLTWHCPELGVAGTWSAKAPAAAEKILWTEGHAAVRWRVLAPRAKVDLRLGAHTFIGWGYAEQLRLNLAPWHLPIDGLQWGRFVSPAHSVVWIAWEHATPRRWLWHNGTEHDRFTIAADAIAWPGGQLGLAAPRTLRSGRLADTVLARWPTVQRWLPAPLQALTENKWCAAATLTDESPTRTHGWVIAEEVRFR